ncbi:MAG: hypothetical protein K9G60_05660 [Pseudolabrys sp.]|nr:hypothetical protein [Pseudolabrys sp.]
MAQGTPEDIVKVAHNYTGQFLKPVQERKAAGPKKNRQKGRSDFVYFRVLHLRIF